jgi:Tol biopolymer transport system component
LIVSSDRSGNPDLWLLLSSGGDMQQLTTDPTPDWSVDWSPDGSQIAFYAYRSGNREIWVQPLAGGPARQLTRGEPSNTSPRWSPDGTLIAFESTSGGIPTIGVVPAAGGPVQAVPSERRHDHSPAWSPDGQSIAFAAPGPRGGHAIWRMRPTGSAAERVTDGIDDWPVWSSDGAHIYFIGNRDGATNVWQVAVKTKTERKMTDLKGRAGFMSNPSITLDRRHIYFAWREDIGDLWVANLVSER